MIKIDKRIQILVLVVVAVLLIVAIGPNYFSLLGGTTDTDLIESPNQLSDEEYDLLVAEGMIDEPDWITLPTSQVPSSPLYAPPNTWVFEAYGAKSECCYDDNYYPAYKALDEWEEFEMKFYDNNNNLQTTILQVQTRVSANNVNDLIREYKLDSPSFCSMYLSSQSNVPEIIEEEISIMYPDTGIEGFISEGGTHEKVIKYNDHGWRYYVGNGVGVHQGQTYHNGDSDAFFASDKAIVSPSAFNTWVGYGNSDSIYITHSPFSEDRLDIIFNFDTSCCTCEFHTTPNSYYRGGYSIYGPRVFPAAWNYVTDGEWYGYCSNGAGTHYMDTAYGNGWEIQTVADADYIVKIPTSSSSQICVPGATACSGNNLHRCKACGTEIEYITCNECEDGACTESPWVNTNCPMVTEGFYTYEAISNTEILKTHHILTVGGIPLVSYGEEFDIPVSVGDMTEPIRTEVEFYDSQGYMVDSITDYTPDVHVDSCPLVQDGTIRVIVSSGGSQQVKDKDIYIVSASISADFPNNVVRGDNIDVIVSVNGIDEDFDVEVKYYDDQNNYIDSFWGDGYSPVPVDVYDYPLSTDGTMEIIVSYSGGDITKTYNVYTQELNIIIDPPDRWITGETFDLGVSFNNPDIAVQFTMTMDDGIHSDIYSGMMPTIQIDNPPYIGDTTLTVTATYLNDEYTKTITPTFTEMTVIITGGTFRYGVSTTINTYLSEYPNDELPVTVLLKKGSETLGEYGISTPNVQLDMPQAIGQCTLEVTINRQSIIYTGTRNVVFDGSDAIQTTARTDEGTQYEFNDIIYYIDVMDKNGNYMTPNYIENIQPVTTLTQGTVDASSYTHLGSGTYKVTAQVTGVGTFIGKLMFDYLGETFTSNPVNIEILENTLSINTVDIPGYATRNEYFNLKVQVFNPLNQKIDPDNLQCLIRYPDGDTTETILFGQMQRLSTGEFTFSYMPTQLETYTFEFTAEKAGMSSAWSTVNVAVSAEGDTPDTEDNPLMNIISFLIQNIWMVIVIFIGIIIAIWKFVIKR